jgi:hypothetical protein
MGLTVPSDPAAATNSFLLDVKGAEVRAALAAAGIRSILLKGPALTHHLHDSWGGRAYADVDLLVEPRRAGAAQQLLEDLGFLPLDGESPAGQTDPEVGMRMQALGAIHGAAWVRPRDGVTIDLHHALPQLAADPKQGWDVLCEHLETITVGGAPTEILDGPASALLVALHAAHHGPEWPKALGDLDRAVEVFDLDCWAQARDVAARLGVEHAMGVGLGLSGTGARVAAALDLPTSPSAALVLLWSGVPWSIGVIEALTSPGSAGKRASLIVHLLIPRPEAMRRGSRLARRGMAGLGLAYAARASRLMLRMPKAVIDWRRLRRTT